MRPPPLEHDRELLEHFYRMERELLSVRAGLNAVYELLNLRLHKSTPLDPEVAEDLRQIVTVAAQALGLWDQIAT